MVSYLDSRKGIWFARFVVPASERERVGKRQVLKSLQTRDKREAQARLPAMLAQLREMIEPPPAPNPVRLRLAAEHGITLDWSDDRAAAALGLLDLAIRADAELPGPTITVAVELPFDADPSTKAAALDRALQRFWIEHLPPDAGDDRTDEELPVPRRIPPSYYRGGPEFRIVAEEIGIYSDVGPSIQAR